MAHSAAPDQGTDDPQRAVPAHHPAADSLHFHLLPVQLPDRVNVGFAKLQMLDALKFSETVYGLGAGIFFIGYVLCGVPSNLALNRFGPRRWIALMMIAWGSLSTCLLFVTTPTEFSPLRLLTGAAEAGFFPGVVLYLSQWFPTFRRGRIMAAVHVGDPGVRACSAARSPAGSSSTSPPARVAWPAGSGCSCCRACPPWPWACWRSSCSATPTPSRLAEPGRRR